jgi:predicted GIY-YIG superfamily endonuclease
MRKGYMYILQCGDNSYYTGSTKYLNERLEQHKSGEGANHTRKYPPVELLYFEEFPTVKQAYEREKQIQGWSRKKKEALIKKNSVDLKKFSECSNESHCSNYSVAFDSAQAACSTELRQC